MVKQGRGWGRDRRGRSGSPLCDGRSRRPHDLGRGPCRRNLVRSHFPGRRRGGAPGDDPDHSARNYYFHSSVHGQHRRKRQFPDRDRDRRNSHRRRDARRTHRVFRRLRERPRFLGRHPCQKRLRGTSVRRYRLRGHGPRNPKRRGEPFSGSGVKRLPALLRLRPVFVADKRSRRFRPPDGLIVSRGRKHRRVPVPATHGPVRHPRGRMPVRDEFEPGAFRGSGRQQQRRRAHDRGICSSKTTTSSRTMSTESTCTRGRGPGATPRSKTTP